MKIIIDKFKDLRSTVALDKNGFLDLSHEFKINSYDHALVLIDSLKELYADLSNVSENGKGFINNPRYNLPVVTRFLEAFGLVKVGK